MSKKSPEFSIDNITWNQIVPTHNKLRSPSSLAYFNHWFAKGIVPERDHPTVLIQTEDKVLYVHDGHHYLTSAYKNNVPINRLDIVIKYYSYAELNDINFDCWYVTPYNPRYYVRRHILPEFKAYIKKLYEISECEAITGIMQNIHLYTERRKVQTLGDL